MDVFDDVKMFLSTEKQKKNIIYIIDADNLIPDIDAIINDKRSSMIICVASNNSFAKTLSQEINEVKKKRSAKVFTYIVNPGKDAADIFIGSILGWCIAKYGRDYNYKIVSRDKIFIGLCGEYNKLGYNVSIY